MPDNDWEMMLIRGTTLIADEIQSVHDKNIK